MIYIGLIVCFLIFDVSILLVEDKIVSKLNDTHKFKQFWRYHFVGQLEDDETMF